MKIWAYLAILVLVVGAAGTAATKIHRSGYDKAVKEMLEQQNEAIETARIEWQKTVQDAEVVTVIEERIVEKIRVVTKEVPKIVETFIRPDCRDLGFEYAGLLNAAVRASNQRSTTEITAAMDDPL
jgi:hypothetical protein